MNPTREACAFENAAPFVMGVVIGLLTLVIFNCTLFIVLYRVVKALLRRPKACSVK